MNGALSDGVMHQLHAVSYECLPRVVLIETIGTVMHTMHASVIVGVRSGTALMTPDDYLNAMTKEMRKTECKFANSSCEHSFFFFRDHVENIVLGLCCWSLVISCHLDSRSALTRSLSTGLFISVSRCQHHQPPLSLYPFANCVFIRNRANL